MKKNYLKPEVEMLDMIVTDMIAASVIEGEDNRDSEVNNHRGEWGNIWKN